MNLNTLVDTQTLADHLSDPGWVVVDCRFVLTDPAAGRRGYTQSHIPGAHYLDLNEDLSAPHTAATGRHPLPDAGRLAERLGAIGIDETKQVVVYDDSFGSMAVRLWWLLRWLGHTRVALLDGVLGKWLREQRPMSADLPVSTPARFVAHADDGLWVNADEVAHALAQGAGLVVDARPEERYSGAVETIDKVAGHIPGTVSRPWEDNLAFNGGLLSADELHEEFTTLLGARPARELIVMCGSGVTACHHLLALEHAGLSGARLYAGSWSEWITDPARPVATSE
jgi:thiosulfate/3-mercaptopyruvate sulfurtransferase